MVATRSMATKATPEDPEGSTLSLRKKPVRRATAKAAQSSQKPSETTAKPTRTTTRKASEPTVSSSSRDAPAKALRSTMNAVPATQKQTLPLSPKKIVQVAVKATPAPRDADLKKPAATANARPRRPLRTAAAKAPEKEVAPPPSRAVAKTPARRGRPRKDEANKENIFVAMSEEPEVEEPPTEEPSEKEDSKHIEEEESKDEIAHDEPVRSAATPKPKPKPTPATTRRTRSRQPIPEDQDMEESEDELAQQNPSTISKPPTAAQMPPSPVEEVEEEQSEDESIDEICGPKTPMRRTWSPVKSSIRPNMFGSRGNTPQTQKVPTKAPAAASPQRPMTVSRGLSKPMVFRPLPRPEERSKRPEPSPSKLANVIEDIAEETQLESESIEVELESEDELHGNGGLSGSDDDDELLLDSPNDKTKEADYEDELHQSSEDEDDETDIDLDHDDETLIQPQLPVELLHSSPLPAAPTVSDEDDMDITMSEAPSSPVPSTPGSVVMSDADIESSPAPSTPGSVIVHRVAEAETPTQEHSMPPTRLSFTQESSLSEISESEEMTPQPATRMSLNTATARMLQTPHMRAFRESNVFNDPSINVEQSQTEEDAAYNANCIDPALLFTQSFDESEDFDLAQEADFLANVSPERISPTLAAQAETMEPATAFDGRISMRMDDTNGARLSLLVDTVLIQPADYIQSLDSMESPSKQQVYGVESRDFAETESPAQQDSPRASANEVPATPPVPRYARPTVASETRSRSKSMSAFGPSTPQSVSKRPTTAETAIKPITSDEFAKLWAAREAQSSSRRKSSSTRKSTPAMMPLEDVTPKSAEPRTSGTRQSTLRSRKVRISNVTPPQQSFQIYEQPATPEIPSTTTKSRKHAQSAKKIRPKTPRVYSAPRTPMKTPLKAPGATPAPFPMTPHPSQPLSSVTALVEIFTLDGSSASGPFIALLQRLGARTTKIWNDRVTHVVFKDGSPSTLQKVRLANKENHEREILCVNSRWVTDCDKDGKRMDERSEEYAVDVDDEGTKSKAAGRHRRRKSMEPSTLKNVDGNVVIAKEDKAIESLGKKSAMKASSRVSLASTFWGTPGMMSPVKGGVCAPSPWNNNDFDTPSANQENQDVDMTDVDDDSFWNEEIEAEDLDKTPIVVDVGRGDGRGRYSSAGYMNRQQELEMLQRTAPVNRLRKLRLREEEQGDVRRLTFSDRRGE